jgi:hypothetical protein
VAVVCLQVAIAEVVVDSSRWDSKKAAIGWKVADEVDSNSAVVVALDRLPAELLLVQASSHPRNSGNWRTGHHHRSPHYHQ